MKYKYRVVGDCFVNLVEYVREERFIYADNRDDAVLAFDGMLMHVGIILHRIVGVEIVS